MGPGFKYHIVTISAIFFALTIGLVVGSVFVSPQFANRQESAILRLQDTLNSDVEEKRQEIEQYRECVAALAPGALRGKLGNTAVAIIQTGDYPDAAAHASEAIALAEPRGTVHITLTSSLNRSPEELRKAFAGPHAADSTFPSGADEFFQTLATLLQRGESTGAPTLAQFEREGLIRLAADDNYSLPIKYAVIVVGRRDPDSDRAVRVDIPLIRSLLKLGIGVVACESRDAQVSDIPALHLLKDDISTIDNVDTDIGRCALVLAFSGVRGDYGIKPGAAHVLPPAPTAQ